MSLYGQKILLKPFTKEDVTEDYLSWLNDAETNKYLETKKATKESALKWLKARLADPTCHFYAIYHYLQHVGTLKLEYCQDRLYLGILLGKDYRGRGYAYDAIKTVLEKVWQKELYVGTYAANKRAFRLYQKLGFEEIYKKKKVITMRLKL